jgi:hypothetical protein
MSFTYSLINKGDTGLKVRTTLNEFIQDANDGNFNGVTGATGATGPVGATGSIVASKKENITLLQTGWTFSNDLYQYEHTDVDIKAGFMVDFVPYNVSIDIVIGAELYPFNAVENEKTIFFAKNLPTDDISGEIIILGTIII